MSAFDVFDHVKAAFEFVLEVGGVAGLIATAYWREHVLEAITRVVRGTATAAERHIAVDGLRQGGGFGDMVANQLEQELEQHGRLDERDRVTALRAEAGNATPGQMV